MERDPPPPPQFGLYALASDPATPNPPAVVAMIDVDTHGTPAAPTLLVPFELVWLAISKQKQSKSQRLAGPNPVLIAAATARRSFTVLPNRTRKQLIKFVRRTLKWLKRLPQAQRPALVGPPDDYSSLALVSLTDLADLLPGVLASVSTAAPVVVPRSVQSITPICWTPMPWPGPMAGDGGSPRKCPRPRPSSTRALLLPPTITSRKTTLPAGTALRSPFLSSSRDRLA
ncbi:hypothetical protein BC828DRAFT_382483 [Blastocladiella britannica]|nr:hypothetical protein BC828DRAFT_382483 [Blastocladiella britannica]